MRAGSKTSKMYEAILAAGGQPISYAQLARIAGTPSATYVATIVAEMIRAGRIVRLQQTATGSIYARGPRGVE